jgi:uncharacterized protein DUF998
VRGEDPTKYLLFQILSQSFTGRQKEGESMKAKKLSLTNLLLLCGAIAGPLFILVVLIQDYTRPGFDPRLYVLSLLGLGDWGWVQVTNFALDGALNVLYAIGLWRKLHPRRAGTWGPILIGAYGLGLVVVAFLRTDPANGFPPGSIAPTQPSGHGFIHALGGLFIFIFMMSALGVFVRYFFEKKQRGWAIYCLTSTVLVFVIFFGGINNPLWMARALRLATLIGWMANSLIAVKLFNSPGALDE